MASQVDTGSAPTAAEVGDAFVRQYYYMLHQSPEVVFKFYEDTSVMGRPDFEGLMENMSTLTDINDKVLSSSFSGCKTSLETVDSQDSLSGGVVVLVKGYFLESNGRKKFTQLFFLAKQKTGGYYVLNDILRPSDDIETLETEPAAIDDLNEAYVAPSTPLYENEAPQDHHALDQTPSELADVDEPEETPTNMANGDVPVELVGEVVHSTRDLAHSVEAQPVVEAALNPVEPAKKSYASIVKVMRETACSPLLPVSTTFKVAPGVPERQVRASTAPDSTLHNSPANNNTEPNHQAADGYSIYIRNLPMDATPAQLEEEFKKFGEIKPDGVQVRSNKAQRFCYGFVQYVSSNSIKVALEASPVVLGGRQCFVEEKKASSSSRGGGRVGGHFSSGRVGGFWNGNQRGSGNFGGRGIGQGDRGNSRSRVKVGGSSEKDSN